MLEDPPAPPKVCLSLCKVLKDNPLLSSTASFMDKLLHWQFLVSHILFLLSIFFVLKFLNRYFRKNTYVYHHRHIHDIDRETSKKRQFAFPVPHVRFGEFLYFFRNRDRISLYIPRIVMFLLNIFYILSQIFNISPSTYAYHDIQSYDDGQISKILDFTKNVE